MNLSAQANARMTDLTVSTAKTNPKNKIIQMNRFRIPVFCFLKILALHRCNIMGI